MRPPLLGRVTTRFVPLPVERGPRTAAFKFDAKRVLRDVPYVPTPEPIVRTMLDAAGVGADDVVYDLGCGDGRIVITAAKQRGARGVGVDIDPTRIGECTANCVRAGVSDRVTFVTGSLFNIDLRPATVVAMYLLPTVNAQLRPKLLAELRPGARIVTHMFPITGWPADRTVRLPTVGRVVHCWTVPAKVGGRWQCTLRAPDGKLHRGTIELEQEHQTVMGAAHLDGAARPLERTRLDGPNLSFALGGVTYYCRVEGVALRGAGRCASRRGTFELRARHV